MAALVLKKTSGDTLNLPSLTPFVGVERAEQKVDLLTGDVLSLRLTSTSELSFTIGDTAEAFGQLYTLNTIPTARRYGEERFDYELMLEGPQYHLLRVVFFDTDTAGNALSSTFTLTGNLSFFVGVLMANLARVFGGAWGLGFVGVPGESTTTGIPGTAIEGMLTDTKTLSFESENCLTVLQRLCAEWGTEFWIDYRPNDAPNRVLTVGPAGSTRDYTFQYGQGHALYELTRKPVQQGGFFTKLYVFGGSRNLPPGYRGFGTRLQLPEVSAPAGLSSPWDSYVQDENAISAYGLIEATKVFEEIYPSRTGLVSSTAGQLKFADNTMAFNLMASSGTTVVGGNATPNYLYLLPGLAAKVHVQTGSLAGYEFELSAYDHSSRTFTLKPYTDERGMVFPSPDPASPFRIATGDQYVLLDIRLPDAYIQAAEQKLLAAGSAYLMENKVPAVDYSLTLDELYWKAQAGEEGVPLAVPPNFFAAGDAIRLVDAKLGIDRLARVMSFTRDALRPYRYTLTLGDARKISLVQRALARQTKINTVIQGSGGNDPTKPTNTPQTEVKDVVTLIQDAVKAASEKKHTLRAGTLPAGTMPILFDSPQRHEVKIEVWGEIMESQKKNKLGIVTGTGRKKPFQNG